MKDLRKLIRETIERHLNESMNMGIDNFKYDDDLDHVLDICHYVIKKIAYELYPTLGLSQEEQEAIGGIGDDYTPDGNDAFEPVGTINFYVGGYPERVLDKIVGYIKYILAEKDIMVGEIKKEKTSEKLSPEQLKDYGLTGEELRVIRIPIIKNESGDSGNPPVVNLSNNNADKLFGEILGFSKEGHGYNFSTFELMTKLGNFKKSLNNRTDIPEKTYTQQNKNIFSPINGKDYYYDMIKKIENFANWAIEKGYTSLYIA